MNEWQQRKTKRKKICVINFKQKKNRKCFNVKKKRKISINSPSIWQGNFCESNA